MMWQSLAARDKSQCARAENNNDSRVVAQAVCESPSAIGRLRLQTSVALRVLGAIRPQGIVRCIENQVSYAAAT
jgi:hypothetical protein